MMRDTNRYFIELHLNSDDLPRHRETEVRRAQAAAFIDQMASWLFDHELNDKAISMAITALGQVQITCEQDIISRLRSDETLQIATIRQSAVLSENRQRVQNWST